MKPRLSCPLCRYQPLMSVADTDGLPKSLSCPQCRWSDTSAERCKALARKVLDEQQKLQDPAERKRRQEAERKARNQSVLYSYRIKK